MIEDVLSGQVVPEGGVSQTVQVLIQVGGGEQTELGRSAGFEEELEGVEGEVVGRVLDVSFDLVIKQVVEDGIHGNTPSDQVVHQHMQVARTEMCGVLPDLYAVALA